MTVSLARLALVLVATLCAACVHHVRGNGRLVEQARPAAAFEAVEVHGGLSVTAATGAPSITVMIDENLQQYVVTRIENGRLIVEPSESNLWLDASRGWQIRVASPGVREITASGGSEVTAVAAPAITQRFEASGGSRLRLGGMKAGDAHVVVSGGSDAELVGTATRLGANVSGGSSLKIAGLDARDVVLEAGSGSSVDLSGASATVDATISGGATANAHRLLAGVVRIDGSGGSSIGVWATQSIAGEVSGGSDLVIHGGPSERAISSSGGSSIRYE